jgi:DNA-binding LacI/PurR family transcriptional regulator
LLRRLVTLNVPVVLAGTGSEEVDVDCVTFDMSQIGRDLTYRLVGEGHRRIGLIRMPRGRPSAHLEEGYRHAMGSAELPVRPSWVVSVDVDLGETGGAAVNALLEERVTALLACSGPLAIASAREADRKGLSIPQDLSLGSVLTSEDAILPSGVKLEGALLEASDLGRAAVRRIMQLFTEQDTIPRREGIEARVVKGGSIGPVPGGPNTVGA